MISTRERILDAAEKMFADQGYSATSVRKIISKARVNLAAVHYHFHSKEELLEAVILRRAIPANQERLELLDACEAAAPGGNPGLEEILRAFLAPSLRVVLDPALGGVVFMRLIARLQAEGDLWQKTVGGHFLPLLDRYGSALRRALPELSQEELFWRVHFAIGATTQALRGTETLELFSGGLCRPTDPNLILDRLIGFVSAGMRAPVAVHSLSGGTK